MAEGTAPDPIVHTTKAHIGGSRWSRGASRRASLALAAACVLGLGARFIANRNEITTDDATVVARTVSLAPELTAKVKRVLVRNHQPVDKGALLVELDSTVFDQSLAKAKGELHAAEAQEEQAGLRLASIQKQHPLLVQAAQGDQAEAIATKQSFDAEVRRVEAQSAANDVALALARQELERSRALQKSGSVSDAQLEQHTARVAQLVAEQRSLAALLSAATSRGSAAAGAARSAGGRATIVVEGTETALAESDRALARARVEQARASVALAEAELARTKITSPIRGIVEHVEVEEGMLLGPPSSMMSIVSTDDMWIEARIKETDIQRIQADQSASIRVDALGSEDVRGHVDGVGSATLSRFAAIPVEATGSHFVRITQRVPVRIRLDGRHEGMRAGLSAIVSIQARR
jgi:membrane fusion protein (multidrug efflux system)